MKNYSVVVFDLDGTLLNTTRGVLESVRYTIGAMGLPMLPDEAVNRFVGPPMQDSFVREYGVSKETAQQAANIFREYYKTKSLLQADVYDGIIELLQMLKRQGKKIAVATYKRHDYAMDILKHFGIADYCDSMNGADNNNVLTKADILNKCLDEVGNPPRNEVVLIGDSEYDGIGAENAGIDFIGVTYGFGFRTEADIAKHPYAAWAESGRELIKLFDEQNISGE